jgi:hypothetical protein
MDAYGILVIILSITLAILLVLCIIIAVNVNKLVKRLQIISDKAEEVIDDVEAVSGFFRKTAGPVAMTGLISNIVSKVAEVANKKGTK